tara:strand:- start:2191 stop:4035 length:1845 start_codon:yes stop_codon:yes gene_type:complete
MTYSPFGLGITTLGTSQASKFVSVDSNGDLIIPDSDKFKFGTGSDMQVYHDGSHGYLTNATGTLKLATETSGIAISIGHTTSEVTVNDNLTVTGDLTVNGTTTTINSTTLTVDDLNIVLASGAADSAAADGAGITIDGASASLIYDHTGTQWEFNKNVEFAGKLLPNADSTYDLGSTSLGWNDLHMGSGGVINFANGDVTLTHSSNTITVAGGTLATAALTATTGTFSGVLKTDDTTDATSTTDGSLQTDGGLSVAKDAVIGNDLILLSDSSVIHFGGDKEITLSHVADTGLTLKHTATADDKPVTLTLATGETDIAADDVIGVINFQAPDEGTGTDAILVAAGIAAVSEGDFAADNNATKLSFRTAASEAASEKMSLSSGGNLTVAGDITVSGSDIILDDGGSLKEGGGTAAFTFDGSGNVTKIGQDSPSSGEFLKYDGSKWVAAAATVSGLAADDISAGDAAINLTTTSGNITIDAQDGDSDIIFKGTDGSSDTTFLTLDGSEAGAATFNSTVKGSVFIDSVEVVTNDNVTVSKGFTGVTTGGSNRTATLPEAAAGNVGAMYTIKKLDSGSGNVSVSRAGDDTIDGGTSVVLYHQHESVTVIVGAADTWYIM